MRHLAGIEGRRRRVASVDGVLPLAVFERSRDGSLKSKNGRKSAAISGAGLRHAFEAIHPTAASPSFVKLFDRSADYQGINTQLNALKRAVARTSELDARRQFAAICTRCHCLQAVTSFPGNRQNNYRSLLVVRKVH